MEVVMKKHFVSILILCVIASALFAAGDSILLYNPGYSDTGIWIFGVNNNGMLDGEGSNPTWLPDSLTDTVLSFGDNEGSYGPYLGLIADPNTPLIGDADGDGVVDPVLVGENIDGKDGALAAWSDRPEGSDAYHGTLVDAANIIVGVGDVSGDGYGDLITRSTENDMWVAFHSDPNGFQNGPDSWGGGNGSIDFDYFFGDFNGDGLTDVGQIDPKGANPNMALCHLSTPYDGTQPPGSRGGIANDNDNTGSYFWSSLKTDQTQPVTYLSGDVNGDGMDDLVEAFLHADKFLCRIYLARTGAANPAGMDFGGNYAWANVGRNTLVSTKNVVPMLADINDDGFADFVIYDEFIHTNNQTYGRIKVVYGDGNVPAAASYAAWNDHSTFGNYEFGYYNYYGIFGQDIDNFVPFVGNLNGPCDIDGDLNGDCKTDLTDASMLFGDWLVDNN